MKKIEIIPMYIRLRQNLNELPFEESMIFALVLEKELSLKEIAEVMECSVKDVKKAINFALEELTKDPIFKEQLLKSDPIEWIESLRSIYQQEEIPISPMSFSRPMLPTPKLVENKESLWRMPVKLLVGVWNSIRVDPKPAFYCVGLVLFVVILGGLVAHLHLVSQEKKVNQHELASLTTEVKTEAINSKNEQIKDSSKVNKSVGRGVEIIPSKKIADKVNTKSKTLNIKPRYLDTNTRTHKPFISFIPNKKMKKF